MSTAVHLRRVRPLTALAASVLVLGVTACDAAVSSPVSRIDTETAAGLPGGRNIVQVTSSGMNLIAPAEIPGGWTTFRYTNQTGVTHFFVLERLPEGKTIADTRNEVVPVFQAAMDLIVAGDASAGFAEFANLPAWFFEVAFMGGAGLTAPGRSSQTTVHLDPGTYVIECYVKTPDGKFHSALGMLAQITVTAPSSEAPEPRATLDVTIDNGGITLHDAPRPGMHTFGVTFAEQKTHEHFLGHDVHLARIADEHDLGALAEWMNWATPAGLSTPAPAEFLGGTQELPAGRRAYFDALLTPGTYALIAEVPDPASPAKRMLTTFTVPAGSAAH